MANGTDQILVEEKGTVNLFSTTCDVLFVPASSSNLLSISKLTKELHCNVIFSHQKVVFQDTFTGRRIGKG